MTPLESLISASKSRLFRKTLFLSLSKTLFWAIVLALGLRLINEFYPSTGMLLFSSLLPFLALSLVFAFIWRRPLRADDVVKDLDRRLQGKEQFVTAYECLSKAEKNDVEKVLVERVNERSSSVDAKSLLPIRTPLEAKLLVLVLPLFLMVLGFTVYEEGMRFLTPIVQRSLLAKPLGDLEKKVEKLQKSSDPNKKKVAEKLKKMLSELKESKDFDDMLGRARKLLDELKKSEGDPQAKATIEKLSKVADFLSRSKTTRQLSQALREGNLQKAAELTRNLAQKLQKSTGMTTKDLQRMASNFKKTAQMSRSKSRAPGT